MEGSAQTGKKQRMYIVKFGFAPMRYRLYGNSLWLAKA
jgi:hypothetical protein